MLAEELFRKALQIFETCIFVNKNLCGKLFPSLKSPATFDEIYFIDIFIPDFNSLICELDNFTVKVLYWVFIY